jgi:hypothetical protein
MKIWKYQIGTHVVTDSTIEVEMPKGAKILHAQTQREIPCVWALVDPDANLETRYFYIVGTGDDMPSDGRYVGTVSQQDGVYIWHIFEVWTLGR